MAVQTITILKSYFETGDVPTEAQYIDLIDTIFNVSSPVYLGPFDNDTNAGLGGVSIGQAYKLSIVNDYGIVSSDESSLKVRLI